VRLDGVCIVEFVLIHEYEPIFKHFPEFPCLLLSVLELRNQGRFQSSLLQNLLRGSAEFEGNMSFTDVPS